MGLISFIVSEVAKDIAFDATLGVAATVAGGVEKINNKREERKRAKEKKDKEQSFTISFDEDDKALLSKKTKARYYTIHEESQSAYRIKRVIKPEKTSLAEVSIDDGKVALFTINEVIKSNESGDRIFIIQDKDKERGKVFANSTVPFRYVASDGNGWDMINADRDYIISYENKAIAFCKNIATVQKKKTLTVTYNEEDMGEGILYLAICLLFMLDPIGK